MSQRSLTIGRPPRTLAACLELADATPHAGAIVCHPHPQYGGDMENAVVVAIARALARVGISALRFDFGDFSGGSAEVEDARTALAALRDVLPAAAPLALVGYSFGAWVALRAAHEGAEVARVVAVGPPLAFLDWAFLPALRVPVAFVVGDADKYCDSGRLRRVAETIRVRVLAGADHFFVGREADVAAAVVTELGTLSARPS
jgi:uncharacterized protein